jgi:hypothetical protein
MASTISAGTTSGTAIAIAGDTSGDLAFKTQAGTYTQTVPNATGTVMVSGNMPAFSVYGSGLVTMSQNTFTKVTFDTEDFDTNNNFASNRFTPTVAGYYQIEAFIYFSVTATGGGFASIFKNGSRYCDGTNFNSTNGNDIVAVVSAIVYCNGSTDYIEIYGYQGYSATAGVGSNNYLRKFCGALVRSA